MSLSIDRYHAIVYPMKFLQGGEQAFLLEASFLNEGGIVFINILFLIIVLLFPPSFPPPLFVLLQHLLPHFMGLVVQKGIEDKV